jgi:hypothetical protein
MATELWLRARVRPRDYDIKEELERRKFTSGEISEMIRDGFRMVLFGQNKKAMGLDPILGELTEKEPNIQESDIEALVDNLIRF